MKFDSKNPFICLLIFLNSFFSILYFSDAHKEQENASSIENKCLSPFSFVKNNKIYQPDVKIFKSCSQLTEFMNKAPLDQVHLVFGSEDLEHPSSSMGHIFLKISGENYRGIFVEHSISFFTRIDDVNFFSLIIKSLFTGKIGYYVLAPYEETKNRYLYMEKRNLWEYGLKLTELEKFKLHLLLFEMRNKKLTYYFHKNNCATLIKKILGQVIDLSRVGHLWITPLDVVRSLHRKNYIESKKLLYSNKWLISKIINSNSVKKHNIQKIKKEKFDEHLKDTDFKNKNYMTYRLAKSYNSYLLESKKIKAGDWEKNKKILDLQFFEYTKGYNLNLSESFAGPEKIIQDSQLSVEYLKIKGSNNIVFSILPISHLLEDNLKGYTFESEVKFSNFSLIFDVKKSTFKVFNIDLLALKNLETHNSLTKGWASEFYIGYNHSFDFNGGFRDSIRVLGGFGKNFRVLNDLDFFNLLKTELLFNFEDKVLFNFESGFILRTIYNSKIIFKYIKRSNFKKNNDLYSLSSTLKILEDIYLVTEYQNIFFKNYKDNYKIFSFKLKYLF